MHCRPYGSSRGYVQSDSSCFDIVNTYACCFLLLTQTATANFEGLLSVHSWRNARRSASAPACCYEIIEAAAASRMLAIAGNLRMCRLFVIPNKPDNQTQLLIFVDPFTGTAQLELVAE